MNEFAEDTISAVATAPGEGGIGIVRLSGAQSIAIASKIFKGVTGKTAHQVASYHAAYGQVIEPGTSTAVDECLLLVMRAPHSYTREDVVELQCHGGVVPLRRVLELTIESGARLAEPGEFTRRAFLNGRLDLAQAEAVIDVIRSRTDASLRMAVGHLAGALSEKIREIRHELLKLIAQLEAAIDFPEDDIEELTSAEVRAGSLSVLDKLSGMLATAKTGQILRDGLKTVIIGRPNVGKSSLLNALLREKRAIVTDIPGTTRDVIEEYVNIKGIPLKIIDTAGIRETNDLVEKIGVEKARELVNSADLILVLLDASAALTLEDQEILSMLSERPAMVLINKTDLPPQLDFAEVQSLCGNKKILKISITEGSGLLELEEEIAGMVYLGQAVQGEAGFINNVRHTEALSKAREHIEEAILTIDKAMPSDCIVIDLRSAWERLGEVTGDTMEADIIQQIFSQFCIGK
ncbi:MAG: tRNA uridine-5-carboxymethylaminomethyl(34) synthesis GTPase MnmE [Pelosinus sp.]|nr:tRNA uridine-5-carboxymethylaminomethyl(34) synthesis GTPase MnmE [Pelosinus sp.]